MAGRTLYVVCAEGEEDLAESLAGPLREAGYMVSHNGTVLVGQSTVGEATKALAAGAPVVLCATSRAIGSRWAHQVVNAGRRNSSVFVVQMEADAYVDQLAVQTKVARYCDSPADAIADLVTALAKDFPPVDPQPQAAPEPADRSAPTAYLDQPVASAVLDIEALQEFRRELRTEVADRHPAALTAWEFLDRVGLRVGGQLTRTGALLFARNPAAACPTAMVKCVRYFGMTKDKGRDEPVTYEDAVPAQIEAARQFVARHVRRGEAPTEDSSRSEPVYRYPMIAVREVLANALVHRDYESRDSCVHVRLYADRLEISSPGAWIGRALEPGVEHSLSGLDGQSRKRNFRLAHVLSWIRLMEGEGSGIPTAVADCDRRGAPRPTVVEDQGFVTVTLRPIRRDLRHGGGAATRVFLSFAEADEAVAHSVASGLTTAGAEVFRWQTPRRRRLLELQAAVERADLFIVLLSPAYVQSRWCWSELDSAIVRETETGDQFVYVGEIAETSPKSIGLLRSYDWLDLRPPVDADKLALFLTHVGLEPPAPDPEADAPRFRDRADETERIVAALTDRGGQDLWLVVAPPGMGKSWFLAQLARTVQQREPAYVSRLVDLRARPAELRADAVTLLCTLLDVDPQDRSTLTDDDRVAIAAQVSNRSRPQLCLLDSGELLPADTVDRLCTEFSAIHRLVDRAGNPYARLCLVVAGRQQAPWRSFGPDRSSIHFRTLALPAFSLPVLRQAIEEENPRIGRDEADRWADALHESSEGVPALLNAGLDWARSRAFLSREDARGFDQVARPYIINDLLAMDSLLPSGDGGLPQRKTVLERALKALAPYRLFTRSHLVHHVSGDVAFGRALDDVEWDLFDLWEALNRTALLEQPSVEIWLMLSRPIRRLLFRHYYGDDTAQRQAHVTAERFYDTWAERLSGTDRAVALVERLWHVANSLLLARPDDFPEVLLAGAVDLARASARTKGYSPVEFAGFVLSRLRHDQEFAILVAPHDGLFEAVLRALYDNIVQFA